ncbi:protease inhibitor [Aeromonas phage ZPAH1]|nr:protease inhibitor [Aeromonas phage ZPAH1]
MLNKSYIIRKEYTDLSDNFPEMVVGNSFEVLMVKPRESYTGMTTIKMHNTGTVYNIEDRKTHLWCFYTNAMIGNGEIEEITVYQKKEKPKTAMDIWEHQEKLLVELLELHRKNKPQVVFAYPS